MKDIPRVAVKETQPDIQNKNNTQKRLLIIGGILMFIAFSILTAWSWSKYDVWDNVTYVAIVIMVSLLVSLVYLRMDDPTQSTALHFSHPISIMIVFTSMMLLLISCIVSSSHFQYKTILWAVTFVFYDISCVLLLQRMINLKLQKKKSL